MTPQLSEHLGLVKSVTDRSERIQLLIDLAQEFRPASRPKPYDEAHRVPGCESEVFIWANPEGDGWNFEFIVENPQGMSAMAMAHLLSEGLKGATVEQIERIPEDIVYDIFGRELSMGKSMGLMGMIRMCKHLVGVRVT